jgi:hypothetical protein
MECPSCKSHDIRRSVRSGLYEGLVLRIACCAPFQCQKCQNRFRAFAPGHRRRYGYHTHHTLAGFLGLPKAQRVKFDRAFKIILIALLLILLGVRLALWFAQQPSGLPESSSPQSFYSPSNAGHPKALQKPPSAFG